MRPFMTFAGLIRVFMRGHVVARMRIGHVLGRFRCKDIEAWGKLRIHLRCGHENDAQDQKP